MSKKEVNQLISLLSAVLKTKDGLQQQQPRASGSAPRRKRRRARARVARATANIGGMPGNPTSSNPRRVPTRILGGEGHMRVSRQELCQVLTTGGTGDASQTVMLDPARSTTNFPWLSGLASSWERIVWHSLRISWRSGVGATTDGMVAYGVDFNSPSTSARATRENVVSLTPVHDGPIWKSTDGSPLTIPGGMLRSRAQFILGASDYNDASPGSLLISVTGGPVNKKVGEVWVHYDVTMAGPRKAGT